MSKNQSRKERKNQEKNSDIKNKTETRSGISRIYYYVIGILFLILLLLVIFIFTRGGNKVNLEDENTEESALVENEETENNNTENTNEEEDTTEEEIDDSEAEEEEDNSSEENSEEDLEEENQETEELEPGESEVVNEDAPNDTSHAVDYNDGSNDRVQIKNEIMAATGLNDDLIEWWIGNDGPGRVEATVSDRNQTEIYQVYLQYGDGNWHVLNYERINSVPNN